MIDIRHAFEDAVADQIKIRVASLCANLAGGQSIAEAEVEFRKGVEELRQVYDSAEEILTKVFA